jgi:hypothetical protein
VWGLRLVKKSWAGFRSVSSILEQFFSHKKIDRAPTPETLIQWELKLGLHKLQRPKSQDQEWVWMADHVVRLGSYKCFVVVGVKMESIRNRKDLTVKLEDLEPMAILPMKKSNGDEVAQKLRETMVKTNICPTGLVIDHGSDLRKGSQKIHSQYPDMQVKYDVCHKVACELKKRLKTDEWETMTKKATETKKAFSMGKFHRFSPPQQRSKARYMNLDTLVSWGHNILNRYNELPSKVREKTAWLLPLEKNVSLWNEWIQIGQIARDTVRIQGFYEGVSDLFINRVIARNLSHASKGLVDSLSEYLFEESKGISYEQRMIGSTESLEGLFSIYKRMAGDNKMSVNGLGRLILCISSRIGEFSEEIVNAAMTGVRCKDVNQWLKQAFENDNAFLEEKWEHSIEERVCNF